MSKQTDAKRTNAFVFGGMSEEEWAEIHKPQHWALTTEEYARLVGSTTLWVAKQCKLGNIQAVKSGRSWLINRAKAFEALGIV